MGKMDSIMELARLMAHSLSHRIGSIVNRNNPYAQKYFKEAVNFFNLAKKASTEENWNNFNKSEIKTMLKKELIAELTKKRFLDNKKFDLIDEEIDKVLKELDLDVK